MSDARIGGYTSALFSIARAEGNLAEVEDEIFRIARSMEGSDELRNALADPLIPPAKRQAIVEDLLGGKATTTTTSFVSMLVAADRSKDLPAIAKQLVQRTAVDRSQVVTEIRSAVPLSDDQRARLSAALSKATGKDIAVKVVVDPSLRGGVVAQVGDTVIDGSIATRLAQLKSRL
jgi:F-type H+-transporting ATPase subunit delta